MKIELKKSIAEHYYFNSENHSWTSFTITENGDLMITGDWGYYCYAWRSFGTNFKEFIISLTPDYLIAKLESNMSLHKKGKINTRQKEALLFFLTEFKNQLLIEFKTQSRFEL